MTRLAGTTAVSLVALAAAVLAAPAGAASRCRAWIDPVDSGDGTVLRMMVDGPPGADVDYEWSVRAGNSVAGDSSVALLQGEPRQVATSRVAKGGRNAKARLSVRGCGDPVEARFGAR